MNTTAIRKSTNVVIALLLLSSIPAMAQTKYKHSDFKKKPVWIQMMRDTSANYFETVKAFREYYKERALPKEPNEVEGKDAFEKEVGLEDEKEGGKKSEREREREKRKQNPKEINYAADVRAFRGWFYENQPWLRSDGSIIGPAQRQAIVDKQQAELKEIEKANLKN